MIPPAHPTMTDLIFIAVTLGFFVLGALYARYCESL
jgi:mannose/fructose/N-acetylgalactosamine-specific phosphotransferase system component IID